MLSTFILPLFLSMTEASCDVSSGQCKSRTLLQNNKVVAKIVDSKKTSEGSVCGEGEEIMDVDCMDTVSMALPIKQAAATLYMACGCTGWIVTKPRYGQGALVLTAGHCGENEEEQFYFNYNHPCGSTDSRRRRVWGQSSNAISCNGTRKARKANPDDYTIYELHTDCSSADSVTPFMLDVGMPEQGEGIYIIGHPNRRPKQISFEEVHDEGHHCVLRQNDDKGSKRLTYFCDTQGGNSGSPVISTRTGFAIAVHTHGGCDKNKDSANSGSWLGNFKNVLEQFHIPCFDRRQNDIFKQFEFVPKNYCRTAVKYDELVGKTKTLCETRCVNALKCVGFNYKRLFWSKWSEGLSTCTIMYEASDETTCKSGVTFYERTPATGPVPTCKCTGSGNQYRCTDGLVAYCEEGEDCHATDAFKKATRPDGCLSRR